AEGQIDAEVITRHSSLVTPFRFPRRPDRDRLCLADYFQPVASGRMDVIALQVVTVGARAAERVERLQQAGDYSTAYYLHGLAVGAAEGRGGGATQGLNRELGPPPGPGRTARRGAASPRGGLPQAERLGPSSNAGLRYSWGSPACPDLDEQEKLYRLMPIEE